MIIASWEAVSETVLPWMDWPRSSRGRVSGFHTGQEPFLPGHSKWRHYFGGSRDYPRLLCHSAALSAKAQSYGSNFFSTGSCAIVKWFNPFFCPRTLDISTSVPSREKQQYNWGALLKCSQGFTTTTIPFMSFKGLQAKQSLKGLGSDALFSQYMGGGVELKAAFSKYHFKWSRWANES